jgi:hypothetical protein
MISLGRTKMKRFSAFAFAISVFSAMPAGATILDNFNRPDSGTLGANWTQQTGSCSITGGAADCGASGLATYNGGSGNTVSADVFSSASTGLDYVTLVLGFADVSNNLFIKLQSQDSIAGFEDIGFYFGHNGGNNGAWSDSGFDVSVLPNIMSAHMVLSLVGTDLNLGLDTNFDGVFDYNFVRHNVPLGLLGTGIGIGGYSQGAAYIDNFSTGGATVPEPATLALLGLGLTGLAASRWKKK